MFSRSLEPNATPIYGSNALERRNTNINSNGNNDLVWCEAWWLVTFISYFSVIKALCVFSGPAFFVTWLSRLGRSVFWRILVGAAALFVHRVFILIYAHIHACYSRIWVRFRFVVYISVFANSQIIHINHTWRIENDTHTHIYSMWLSCVGIHWKPTGYFLQMDTHTLPKFCSFRLICSAHAQDIHPEFEDREITVSTRDWSATHNSLQICFLTKSSLSHHSCYFHFS